MADMDEIKEEVRSRSDIVDVISGYVHLQKKGNNYFGLCPFHNEKSGSFSVNRQGQFFHCFGCHKGGDVFTFLCEYESITFPEALKILADRGGVKLPDTYTGEDDRVYKRKKTLYDINRETATFFYAQLRSERGTTGLNYFNERKLSPETMKEFGLGYAPMYTDALVKYLRSKGYKDEDIRDSGVAVFDERDGLKDKFINRVMFPILDRNGKVIGFGGRVLGDAKPKYLNSPETEIFNKSVNLYALNKAIKSRADNFILCEGYMDVIALHQAGVNQAVASLGTAFTSQQASVLKRFSKDVLLAYDSDEAGVTACIRNSGILREHGISGKVINMEPYKDPDEFIKNLGVEEFRKRIENAENSFLFEIRKIREKYGEFDSDHPEKPGKFYDDVAIRLLQNFEDNLERESYLDSVCRKYDIDKNGMVKLMQSKAAVTGIKHHTPLKDGNPGNNIQDDGIKKMQRVLITYLVEDPSLYKKISEYITPEDFTEPIYKRIASGFFEQLEKNEYNPAAIIGSFEELEEQRIVAEVFNTKLEALESNEDNKKVLRDLVIGIKKNSLLQFNKNLGKEGYSLKDFVDAKKALEKLEKSNINF